MVEGTQLSKRSYRFDPTKRGRQSILNPEFLEKIEERNERLLRDSCSEIASRRSPNGSSSDIAMN